MKAYTRRGDDGTTSYFSGKRVSKDSQRIEIMGKIDSLQSAIDELRLRAKSRERKISEKIQLKLWQTAGEIALASKKYLPDILTYSDLEELERTIDSYGAPPKKFVRFDKPVSVAANECRVRTRELERNLTGLRKREEVRPEVYSYLNRLSSLFFIMAYKNNG